jgi:peptidoglycan/LPS O-acetylase OafA/YrhL
LKYRPEIDGLRALAVVPVILFHAGFELFSGGFVGVDVFFVISGYLITTILIEDIENKRFSIVNFYERRARRILPALFFVMLVCIPFAWMWMLPSQMKDFSQSLIAVSLFASNILFWRKSGYFAAAAEEKPLLHTWSLAVEEQYYVLFPIFLILAWRFGKNRVFWMIVVMAAISLLLSEWGWRNKSTANFYLAPTRAWELFAGSIAAFIVQKRGVQKNNLLSVIGLSAIIFSIFFYDETTPFPSVYALVPVLGVVLLVLYADKETLAARLLSTKGFVGIGLISYSAYLWHQPLFSFARIRSLEHPSLILMSALSAISILLAYVSWRYIEKPFRCKRTINRIQIFATSLVLLTSFSAIGLVGHFNKGFLQLFEERIQFLDGFKTAQIRSLKASCTHITGFKQRNICVLGNEENIKGIIIGDSHAAMLSEPLNRKMQKLGVGILSFTDGDCPPIIDVWRRDTVNKCNEYNKEAIDYIKSNEEIEYIILSGRWTIYVERNSFDNKEGGVEPEGDMFLDVISNGIREINSEEVRQEKLLKKMQDTLANFDSLNRKIFVVFPVPEVGFEPAHNEARYRLHKALEDYDSTHSYDVFLNRNQKVRVAFNEIDNQLNSTVFFDVSNNLCSEQTRRCNTFNQNNIPLYYDDDHLSSVGSEIIVEEIQQWISANLPQ